MNETNDTKKTAGGCICDQPHLENFFNAIRGAAKLNCPADEAFASEYVIHKANKAIVAKTTIVITQEELKARLKLEHSQPPNVQL